MGPRRKAPVVCLLFWFLMACQGVEQSASINHEGIALLRFKEMIEADPYDALSDWDGRAISPCSWFGVECSDDGRVMALNLEDLGLKGMLSPELGRLTHMKSLILHNNSFYGVIPREMGDLQELKVLDLGYNNFNGTVPSELGNILSLEFLLLKGNRLSGGLSAELHELNRFCEFQVHEDLTWSNKASVTRNVGNAIIRRLLAAKQSHPQKNRMHGSATSGVAVSVSKTTEVPTLDVPRIVIRSPSAVIPHREVPPPRFPPPSPPSLPPLILPPPPPETPSIEQPTSQESKHGSSLIIYASIGAAICFVAVALSAVYFLCYRRKKTSVVVPLSASSSGELQTASAGGITSYRRSELETACEGFSNIIGSLPGFTLYKGTLPCGAEIAVVSPSVASAGRWSSLAEAQFKKKVEVLSKVNHKNFMDLLGYCEDEEPFTRMMVFEYVPNGTLFEHLHIKEAEHLDWQSRLRVAMGVIYCLEYMHEQNPPVILRSLNSSCVYLTEDNAAKISDIRFWSNEKEDEPDSDGSDEESTVYKFALLLLEMISGRLPYSDDDGLLVLWALSYLTGNRPLTSMIDPMLKSVPEEHVSALCELIQSCINQDSKARPTVAEVAKRMKEITETSPAHAIPRRSPLWWAELEIITS